FMITEYITARLFCRACQIANTMPTEMKITAGDVAGGKEATAFQCPGCSFEVVVVLQAIDPELVEAVTVHRPRTEKKKRKSVHQKKAKPTLGGGAGSGGSQLVN